MASWLEACLEAGEVVDEAPFEVVGGSKDRPAELHGPRRSREARAKGEPGVFEGRVICLYGSFDPLGGVMDKKWMTRLIAAAGGEVLSRLPDIGLGVDAWRPSADVEEDEHQQHQQHQQQKEEEEEEEEEADVGMMSATDEDEDRGEDDEDEDDNGDNEAEGEDVAGQGGGGGGGGGGGKGRKAGGRRRQQRRQQQQEAAALQAARAREIARPSWPGMIVVGSSNQPPAGKGYKAPESVMAHTRGGLAELVNHTWVLACVSGNHIAHIKHHKPGAPQQRQAGLRSAKGGGSGNRR